MQLHQARPSRVLDFCQRIIPWLMGAALSLGAVGLYLGLIWSPADYQQGETVRIMYIHVPSSWGALALYTAMAVLSGIGLVKRLTLCHLITQAAAPVGLVLCVISLCTGSIWGYPTWGTWWVWDARLTSMLLLAFLYAGFILLSSNSHNQEKNQKAAAFIALIGWINVPIIKWSVDWWNTLHQPASIMRLAKPAIHWTMMMPLLIMTAALLCFCLALIAVRLQTILLHHQYRGRLLRETYP